MNIPSTLHDKLYAGKIIPFVGAGVSMAALEKKTRQPLYPGWRQLLVNAASKLLSENKEDAAAQVRSFLDTGKYIEAAEAARDGLQSTWFDFLGEQLNPSRERVDGRSLLLARVIWQLGSRLVITTNYDRVLQWSCPNRDDLNIWDIEAPAEQAQALREGASRPTLWHLHGSVSHFKNIIFAPDGYSLLYPSYATEHRYKAALKTLDTFVSLYCFLFIGFSFRDVIFSEHMRNLCNTYDNALGPHYVLLPNDDTVEDQEIPAQIITYGTQKDLMKQLDVMRDIVKQGSKVKSPPDVVADFICFSLDGEIEKLAALHDTQTRYNIVVAGKTGVGKSSLINYLFDKPIRKVGAAKPTTEIGFHPQDLVINGVPARLFDSAGLEVGSAESWRDELLIELNKRGTDRSAEHWFHTVLYCVAGSSSRFEDFEREIIKQFVQRKYRVLILITKADLVSADDLNTLEQSIRRDVGSHFLCIRVCSEGKLLISGFLTETFGKQEILYKIYEGFWESISVRLPDRCISILAQIVTKWSDQQKLFIRRFTKWNNIRDVYDEVEAKSKEFLQDLAGEKITLMVATEIERTGELYSTFCKMLDYSAIRVDAERIRMLKSKAFDYAKEHKKVVWLGYFTVGISLLFARDGNANKMNALLDDFVEKLQQAIRSLRPDIEKSIENILRPRF